MSASARILESPFNFPDQRPGLCLLVVEDDEGDAYLIGRTLADNPKVGKIVHAWDGAEALAMVERGEVMPDLALIDLHMPRMDGLDLLVAFTSRMGANFPMVVLTSSQEPSDAIRSKLRSATRVVTKPETLVELYAVLTHTIEAVCDAGPQKRERPGKAPEYFLMDDHRPLRRIERGAE